MTNYIVQSGHSTGEGSRKSEEMAGYEQVRKSRVVKIDSEETWDFFITKATKEGCPVIIHFTASWCMPSVAMNSLFEELAHSYKNILFLSVDVDEVQVVTSKMNVKAMPTFVFMREEAEVDKLVGANPEEIKKRINGFI